MAKISKRQLKEDKFVTSMFRGYDYIRDNSGYLIGLFVLLLVIGGGIYGFISFRKNIEKRQIDMLGRAEMFMRYGDFEAAETQLQELIDNHPKSVPGKKAVFFMANLNLKQFANFEEAIELFERYIENPLEGEKELALAAKVGIAASHEELMKFDVAADKYLRIYEEHPEYFDRANLLFSAGRCFIYANKFQEAIDTYEKFLKNHKGAPNYDKAQMFLARLEAAAM